MEAQQVSTPEVEFRTEEYNDSFFPSMRADTMKSIETQTDGNMGEIVQRLDSLDDFFDENDSGFQNPSFNTMPEMRGYPGSFADTSASLYDQQTAPILRKSLARNPSSSSFYNGLAETSRPPTRLEGALPTASPQLTQSPTSMVTATSGSTLRPAMHNRSVTSPSNHLVSHTPTLSSTSMTPSPIMEMTLTSDSEVEESFSDLDERVALQPPSRSTPTSMPRKGSEGTSSIESRIRSGMRRLTISGREKERQRDLLRAQRANTQRAGNQNSPRVPKVPAEYLTGSTGSPTSPGQGGGAA